MESLLLPLGLLLGLLLLAGMTYSLVKTEHTE